MNMDSESARQKLIEIFEREIIIKPEMDLDPYVWEFGNTDGWDSLGMVRLLASVEREFQIDLSKISILKLLTFESILHVVHNN